MTNSNSEVAVAVRRSLSVLAMMSVGMGAHAEEKRGVLEEVVVTAQKRQEKLQDVPIAITAVTSEELQTKGITDFPAVLREMPTIYAVPFLGGSTGSLNVSMRGLGSALGGNADSIDIEGSVGLYLDGFYLARSQAMAFDLADVERVEVLRGPQGTLYGRNTTGGAINLISKKPTGEFGLKQTLDFGNRNEFRSVTAINLPKWNDLSAKVTLLRSGIDGLVKNLGPSNDFNAQKQLSGRLQLHWEPSASFAADYFFDLGTFDETVLYRQNPGFNGLVYTTPPGAIPSGQTYTYFASGRPMTTTYRPFDVPWQDTRYTAQGLTLTWNYSDALTVKSLTGIRTTRFSTPVLGDAFADSLGIIFDDRSQVQEHEFSQELQFIGDFRDKELSYVAGLFYFRQGGTNTEESVFPTVNVDFAAPGDPTQLYYPDSFGVNKAKGTSQAVFGQITWRPGYFDRRLELTLGARYTKDYRAANNVSATTMIPVDVTNPLTPAPIEFPAVASPPSGFSSKHFVRFNPAFIANYKWTEDLATYAKVSTGYRAGGLTGGLFSPPASFAPETITSYEVGLKSDWLDRRMRLNVAAFSSDYKDIQMTIPINPADITQSQVYNVGKATIRGLEVELLVSPIEDLTLGASYAYLDASFERVDVIPGSFFDPAANPQSPYVIGDNIKNEFVLPHAPTNSLDLNADYTFFHIGEGALSAFIDYRWQGRQYSVANAGPAVAGRDLVQIRSYGLLDARLTFATDLSGGGRTSVSLWGKNLTNKEYPQNLFGLSASTGGGTAFIANTVSWAALRSYGVSLAYEF